MKNVTLKELIALDLPKGFLQELNIRLGLYYKQAHDFVQNNPSWGKPEADYMLGHYRRGLCEAGFRELAETHNIEFEMMRPGNGGCQHVQIICGRFRFALCHVQSRGAFPRHSYNREQYASINEHVAQSSLFPVKSVPSKNDIFGIIVHTESEKKENFSYAGFGFPNKIFSAWIDEPINIFDVIESQTNISVEAEEKIDKAQPRLKVQPQYQDNKLKR